MEPMEPMEPMETLKVYRGRDLVFTSERHWLLPLLDLEQFLATQPDLPAHELRLEDRVIGRAAALFMVHLSVAQVHAGVLSRPGRSVLDRFELPYTFDQLVDRIECRSEQVLADEWSPERAAAWIRERAQS